jgi:hypothetical protein
MVKYSPRPSYADEDDMDDEEYRVIRASDGRPLAYLEKGMWKEDQQFLAKLFLHSPDLLELVRELRLAAKSSSNCGPILARREWIAWLLKADEVHRSIWGYDQEDEDESETPNGG